MARYAFTFLACLNLTFPRFQRLFHFPLEIRAYVMFLYSGRCVCLMASGLQADVVLSEYKDVRGWCRNLQALKAMIWLVWVVRKPSFFFHYGRNQSTFVSANFDAFSSLLCHHRGAPQRSDMEYPSLSV